jgi:hypothetical protein
MAMRPSARVLLPALVAGSIAAGVTGVLGSRIVDAKTAFDSPYTLAQTYNAALRLVRVDLGMKVTERDPSAAYVMFDYKSGDNGQRTIPGSIEMLDSSHSVKVIVQLSQMPRYHEQVLSDALRKKLRDEYGEPVRARSPSVDAGQETGPADPAQ